MLLIIDGHNLIPKIPGLSLRADNDEMQLIELLQHFARVKRKRIEVYFDKAAQGYAGVKKFGTITAHFVSESSSADWAIRNRLEKSLKGNRETCVISSDREVQNAARLNRAQVQSCEVFAKDLIEAFRSSAVEHQPAHDIQSDEEVEEWMRIFGESSNKKQS